MSKRASSRSHTRRGKSAWLRHSERAFKSALLPWVAHLFLPRTAASTPSLFDARRILLIRQDNRLGNLVLLSPFLEALRRLAPQAHIALLSGEAFADLFERCEWIDEHLIERKRWFIRHPWAYPAHLRHIRGGRWEIAFELSNADTHSFSQTLHLAVSGAPLRVGFAHPSSRRVLNASVAAPAGECHYALAPLLLLSALGERPPLLPLRLPSGLRLAATRAAPSSAAREPFVLIHPGGRGPKGWSVERFAALVASLREAGEKEILVVGGRSEEDRLLHLRDEGAQVRRLHGLVEFVALLSSARLYVGCDAGPLHVAAAAGVPTVSLFLRSHPLRYAPLGDTHEALLLGVESRAWLERADQARGEPAARRGDPTFAEVLRQMRPRMIAPPVGLDPLDEVAFVRQRVELALERSASITRPHPDDQA